MEELVKKAQDQIDYESAHDPEIKNILKIVKEFIQKKKVLCYGGTAINNLLPPEDRFYDPEYDIPDYDFYSMEPQIHALQLADEFYAAGYRDIEVKPGSHIMTFKVFVNYTGVADITYLEPPIFEKLWKEDLHREKIHYASPNFLRMSMYLELSRPRGDVSRWSKVYKRLLLLNKHYPIKCTPHEGNYFILSDEERVKIERLLESKNIVLLGIHAVDFHSKKRTNVWQVPIDVLVEPDRFEKTVEEFQNIFGDTKVVPQPHYAELLPEHADILRGDNLLVRIFKSFACHSFHKIKDIHVASIPTLLQFFFGFLYASSHFLEGFDENRIICISQRLVDLAHSEGKRRFEILTPIDCIGHQETLREIKSHKASLYEKNPKGSLEFLRLFFSYRPGTLNKTRKRLLKERLRKSMKKAFEVDELVSDQTY
jgi:uracil-DNA glycosylase